MAAVPHQAPPRVRYELHHDQLEGTFEIQRVEVVGRFGSRAEARQHMIDTTDERHARDGVRSQDVADLLAEVDRLRQAVLDAARLAALEGPSYDLFPNDWDDLSDRGLVRHGRDVEGEGYVVATDEGRRQLVELLAEVGAELVRSGSSADGAPS